jgi:hypothetical protein
MAKEFMPTVTPMPKITPRKIVPLPLPSLALSFTLPFQQPLNPPYPLNLKHMLAIASALALSPS